MTTASVTRTVKFAQKGEPGVAGKRGMLPFPAGEYSTNTKYTATANVAPYVLLSGVYYVMNKVGTWLGTSTGKTPAQDYATNGINATWIPFENFKAIYVELLMAKLGLIGKAVFYDEYMFSQHGTDASGNPSTNYQGFADGTFKPNLLLNFLTGDSELAGKIIAKEDSQIAGMKVVGNSLRGVQAIFGVYNILYQYDDSQVIIRNIDKQHTYIFSVNFNPQRHVRLPSGSDLFLKGLDKYNFELTLIVDLSSTWPITISCNGNALIYTNGVANDSISISKGEVVKLIYHGNAYFVV